MAILTTQATPLPADLAISDYSRNFYDGTYKWNSEGFTDDNGAYRDFDCYNPAARAPTPLPPMDLGDYEEDMGYEGEQDSMIPTGPLGKTGSPSADQHQRKDSLVTSEADQSKVPSLSPQSELSDYPSDLSDRNVHGPTFIGEQTTVKKMARKEGQQGGIETPKRRPTTRGIAQKVKKSAKKTATQANKSSSPVKSSPKDGYTRGVGSSSRRRSMR